MAANEKTSPAVAKIAAKALKSPTALTSAEIKKLAASALTQAADKPTKVKAKAKAKVKKAPAKKKPAAKKKTARKAVKKK
jgi:hypothetical protein